MSPAAGGTPRLRKELGLFDVYAISTGAMFSSGFFLLPGLAAAQTGSSVSLAYLVAALIIMPPALCVAELATAMPRAGGAYYFLDRSLGPWIGTVGGLGTWIALVLKSAFALVGLGAYLSIYFELPIRSLAVVLTVAFMAINIAGAKETSGLQRMLVVTLLAVMALFLGAGLTELVRSEGAAPGTSGPFFSAGLAGFFSTVGFVFVSYAGLTKVASVAEEVVQPDRNIPLGMALSLGTAALVYTVGVYIMVALLPSAELHVDLTPAASAAAEIPGLSGAAGTALIVVAALAAFASTGNAGVLAASRYPLAMARDQLVPPTLGRLGRFHTPTMAIATTAGLMILAIVTLPIEDIAKLASAFQLLLFSLLSLAVVIMRESGIPGYDPGYRSPWYPWLHVVAFFVPMWLIAQMGQLAILFTLGLVAVTTVWYLKYASARVGRAGAIFHTLARLGERRTPGLDTELRHIIKEKGLREDDPFRELVARALVVDLDGRFDFHELLDLAADRLSAHSGFVPETLSDGFRSGFEGGFMPIEHGVALPHLRIEGLDHPVLMMARTPEGLVTGEDARVEERELFPELRAVFFLVSPADDHGYHLRLLGHLASLAEQDGFLDRWCAAASEAELREALMDQERLLTLVADRERGAEPWIGRALRDLDLPPATLIIVIRRGSDVIVPSGETVVERGDAVTLIGEPDAIRELEVGLRSTGAPDAQ